MRSWKLRLSFLQRHLKDSYIKYSEFSSGRLTFATMRFVFTFIGIYLMVLSCLPCGDGQDANISTGTMTSLSVANNEEHQHANEVCPPFCVCSCCAATSFFITTSKMALSKYAFRVERSHSYSDNILTRAQYTIWQPPRVS